ncbi:MAG: hypothetical protein ACREK3_00310 [Gemmatimonadota bacterium]
MANLTESPERTTDRRDVPVRQTPGGRPGVRRSTTAARGGGTRRPPFKRLLLLAVAVAASVHLLLLWAVRVPMAPSSRPGTEVTAIFEPVVPTRPETEAPSEAPSEPTDEPVRESAEALPSRSPIIERPAVPIARPRPSEQAPELRTIPPTTLTAPLTPLEATPGGIRRRTSTPDARRTAIIRAESLLAARLRDLPGAGVPEEPSIGLAEGGLTVPIPWGGFVPENRKDRVWREERCSGKDADEADKPGEADARRSQCD